MIRFVILLVAFVRVASFDLPGNAAREFKEGDAVDLKVTQLTSDIYQVPYEYYYLKFCPPADGVVTSMDESLGQILIGDAVVNTPYDLRMRKDDSCRTLCSSAINAVDFSRFAYMIDGEYDINWLVDSLPAATRLQTGSETWMNGFPVGFKKDDKYYLHNHASFTIMYHESDSPSEGFRVVGVDVEPRSMLGGCSGGAKDSANELTKDSTEIVFSYDVKWVKSEVAWASRWDAYLKVKENKIHWFSILNSLLVVMLLTGLIALVLFRTLHKDIAMYNSVILDEESSALDDMSEEVGWKLVHGDVFRKPRHAKLLAVFIGSGVQLLFMVIVSLALAAVGLLSPTNRGSFLQAALLIFTFTGSIAGYVSARIYKMFKGEDWRTTTLWSGLIFPGVAFSVFFGLDLLLWYEGSSAAVPFSAMAVILVLWLGISIPLVYIGAYRGYSRPVVEFPVRVHQIPRQIPRQPWYNMTLIVAMIGGMLPFGAVSTELIFLMGSIWHHQFYYLFGFLFVVVVILIVTCAEISVAMTYLQLTREDYHWWWRSFLTSAFSGLYLFLYSLIYLSTKLHLIGFVSVALYLGYMALAAFTFFLLTGSVGAIASFYFVKGIYGSIKID